jgi:choline transport protein
MRVPLNALGLVTIVIALLMLINLGFATAAFAILSLLLIALMMSYVIPIIFFALAKLRGDHIPFDLGRRGLPVNLFAIVYGISILILLPFPPYLPVTATNMSYSGPILGAILLLALFDWSIW